MASLSWEEADHRWRITTTRGDSFTSTFLGVGTGPFVVPKLPAVKGVENYQGHTFHTSRWDYEYTGGADLDANGHMDVTAVTSNGALTISQTICETS